MPDQETRQIMQRYYAGLKSGKGKQAALQEAQLAVIEQRRREHGAAHPFYWASFVVVGDPGDSSRPEQGNPSTSKGQGVAPASTAPAGIVQASAAGSPEHAVLAVSSKGPDWRWLLVGGVGIVLILLSAGLVWLRLRWTIRNYQQPGL